LISSVVSSILDSKGTTEGVKVRAHNALAIIAGLVVVATMSVVYHVLNNDVFVGAAIPNQQTQQIVLTLRGMNNGFETVDGMDILTLEKSICHGLSVGLSVSQVIAAEQSGGMTIFQATDAVAVAQEVACPPGGAQ
jgi:hypothetical protein